MIKNCTEKALWFVSLPKLCYIQYIKNGIFKKEIAKFTKFTLRMRRELTIPPSGQSQWRAPVSYWERDADCMPAVVSHWEKWKPRSSHVVDINENSGKIFCHENDINAEFSKYFLKNQGKKNGNFISFVAIISVHNYIYFSFDFLNRMEIHLRPFYITFLSKTASFDPRTKIFVTRDGA